MSLDIKYKLEFKEPINKKTHQDGSSNVKSDDVAIEPAIHRLFCV